MKNNFPIYRFPLELFRKAGQHLAQEKILASKEIEKWERTRNALNQEKKDWLDEEFNNTFIKLQSFFYKLVPFEDAEPIKEALSLLVARGASAGQMDPYELGKFNVAGIVKELVNLSSEKELVFATEIVKLCLIAKADMSGLKAYVGNGGAPSLYWLCEYLSLDIGQNWLSLKDERQYKFGFQIFSLLLAYAPEATQKENYCAVFIHRLQRSENVSELQKEAYLKLIHCGLVPSNEYYYASLFGGISFWIKEKSYDWLPFVFPFQEKELEKYIDFLMLHLKDLNAGTLLNAFKTTREGRNYFKAYFHAQPHWLLTYIVQHHPDSIFGLVRGHEYEILEPFLKHYKKELIELRDKKGNTLLHAAVLSGKNSEKLVSRLLTLGLSPKIFNQEGETAEAILQRKNSKN